MFVSFFDFCDVYTFSYIFHTKKDSKSNEEAPEAPSPSNSDAENTVFPDNDTIKSAIVFDLCIKPLLGGFSESEQQKMFEYMLIHKKTQEEEEIRLYGRKKSTEELRRDAELELANLPALLEKFGRGMRKD